MDSVDSETKTIRIQFYYIFPTESAGDDKECFVDFIADNNEIKCIVVDLKKELETLKKEADDLEAQKNK
jgi:hypothetical protein